MDRTTPARPARAAWIATLRRPDRESALAEMYPAEERPLAPWVRRAMASTLPPMAALPVDRIVR